jgi:hypothetical protein
MACPGDAVANGNRTEGRERDDGLAPLALLFAKGGQKVADSFHVGRFDFGKGIRLHGEFRSIRTDERDDPGTPCSRAEPSQSRFRFNGNEMLLQTSK